jgi:hypothetical protein
VGVTLGLLRRWIHGYFIHLLDMLAHEISVLWVPTLRRAHSAPLGVPLPEDVASQDAHRVCSEWLSAWRQSRWVEGDAALTCPPVANVGRSLLDTSSLANQNTLPPFHVGLKRRKRKLTSTPLAPFEFPHFFLSLFLVGVIYPRYRGPPVMAQNSRYDMFPPTTNG